MTHENLIRRFSACFVAFLNALLLTPCPAQSSPSQLDRNIAFIKPYPWSSAAEITDVITYASCQAGPKYTTFVSSTGKSVQYDSSRVVELVPAPRPADYTRIASQDDLAAISSVVLEYKEKCEKIPSARTALEPVISSLQGELNHFASGAVKIDGEWMPRSVWERKQSELVASQLRANAFSASEKAKRDADAAAANEKTRVEKAKLDADVAAANEKTRVASEFTALITAFRSADSNIARCESILRRLQDPKFSDAKVNEITREWTEKKSLAEEIKKESHKLLEGVVIPKVEGLKKLAELPLITDPVESQIEKVFERYSSFESDSNIAALHQFLLPECEGLKRLHLLILMKKKIADAELLAARSLAETCSEPQGLGKKYAEIQMYAQQCSASLDQTIAVYSACLQTAKELEVSGKPGAALKKYQEAYLLVKTPEIAAKVSSIREESLGL